MTRFLLLVFFCFGLLSCKQERYISETPTYRLEVKSPTLFKKNFTNSLRANPLAIKADRISAKELFACLLDCEVTDVAFGPGDMENKMYRVVVEAKKDSVSIREGVLEELLEHWHLQITQKRERSYLLVLQDSTKLYGYRSAVGTTANSVNAINGTVVMKNVNLNQLVTVVNSKFGKRLVAPESSIMLDYTFKETSFELLEKKLKTDLGLVVSSEKRWDLIYYISNK